MHCTVHSNQVMLEDWISDCKCGAHICLWMRLCIPAVETFVGRWKFCRLIDSVAGHKLTAAKDVFTEMTNHLILNMYTVILGTLKQNLYAQEGSLTMEKMYLGRKSNFFRNRRGNLEFWTTLKILADSTWNIFKQLLNCHEILVLFMARVNENR